MYDDEDILRFMEKHFPQYIEKFNRFKHNIERVDFWRYAVLYVKGGVYADLDVYPLKSIDIWLEKNCVVLGKEPIKHARQYDGSDTLICNAFMISPQGERFWLDLMDYIIENYSEDNNPVMNTGPGIITKFYKKFGDKYNVIITEPEIFYPIDAQQCKEENYEQYCKDAFVVHMWEGSWCSKKLPSWAIALIIFGIVFIILLILFFVFSVIC